MDNENKTTTTTAVDAEQTAPSHPEPKASDVYRMWRRGREQGIAIGVAKCGAELHRFADGCKVESLQTNIRALAYRLESEEFAAKIGADTAAEIDRNPTPRAEDAPDLRAAALTDSDLDAAIIDALAQVWWRNGAYEDQRAAVIALATRMVHGEMSELDRRIYEADRFIGAYRKLRTALSRVAAPVAQPGDVLTAARQLLRIVEAVHLHEQLRDGCKVCVAVGALRAALAAPAPAPVQAGTDHDCGACRDADLEGLPACEQCGRPVPKRAPVQAGLVEYLRHCASDDAIDGCGCDWDAAMGIPAQNPACHVGQRLAAAVAPIKEPSNG